MAAPLTTMCSLVQWPGMSAASSSSTAPGAHLKTHRPSPANALIGITALGSGKSTLPSTRSTLRARPLRRVALRPRASVPADDGEAVSTRSNGLSLPRSRSIIRRLRGTRARRRHSSRRSTTTSACSNARVVGRTARSVGDPSRASRSTRSRATPRVFPMARESPSRAMCATARCVQGRFEELRNEASLAIMSTASSISRLASDSRQEVQHTMRSLRRSTVIRKTSLRADPIGRDGAGSSPKELLVMRASSTR